MKERVSHYLRWGLSLLCIALFTFGCVPVTADQSAGEPEQVEIVGKQQFEAKVTRVEDTQLAFQRPGQKQQQVINLAPKLVENLRLSPGRRYNVLANQRPTAGGLAAAVLLRDSRGLYAIAESIRDLNLLQPAEREGIQVQQLPTQDRTLVYEDSCKIIYNVPTEFMLGEQRTVLQAYETRTVQVGNTPYTLSLAASQFVVTKGCSQTFEGSRSQVDYTLVRGSIRNLGQ